MPKSKTRKRKHKKKSLTRTKFRSPTSLSIFPERSPQLQGDEPSILNKFTTKYISIQNKRGQQWNTVENDKLAYKRSARGAPIGSYPKIVYGPKVQRLTKENYKKLKKGTQMYYDRESVAFRGPFTFEKILRGPNILVTGRDIGYLNKTYKFTLPVSKLKTEILYFQVGKSPRRKTIKRKRTVTRRRKTNKHKRTRK